MQTTPRPKSSVRLKLALRGAVQGVGFRPFVYRLAAELGVTGWINNSPQGVMIEAEGRRSMLELFHHRLEAEKPSRCFIQSMESIWLDAIGFQNFEIRNSESEGEKSALVLADIATCPDCQQDIFEVQNRRFRYPFTNCTNCGPRFSIIEGLPYDRANTSMRQFAMCPACRAEYENPLDRRFHAQPNACPVCGPRLEMWNSVGDAVFGGDEALGAAAQAIRRGSIVAVKGIGGFHLMVDARNDRAVGRLRERKRREEKPFALMFASLEGIQRICNTSPIEERLLRSPEAPIVLLRRRQESETTDQTVQIAAQVAPGNPNYGVMLPSNPLHHLLMTELKFPVVATSGNAQDEPICIDEREALERLRGIADVFLVHDRPVIRQVDDSIVRVVMGREMVLRRSRGYAPLPIQLKVAGGRSPDMPIGSGPAQHGGGGKGSEVVLAVGAHLKNSVALVIGPNVFISQHIGDLETEPAAAAFRRVIADLQSMFGTEAQRIAADLHPDYQSTKFARGYGKPLFVVQHHVAHVLSCVAESEVELPALGVAWDGTGYGPDGTIWGGEFFLIQPSGVQRVASLRPFALPGGDTAIKEPRRAALGLLYEMYGDEIFMQKHLAIMPAFSGSELALLRTMLVRGLNSPRTSSMGRLFDAVASLTGLRQQTGYEGQAAMELEYAVAGHQTEQYYEMALVSYNGLLMPDWFPLIRAIMADRERGLAVGEISAKFHNALAEVVVEIARQLGQSRVVLSGGCFQNRYILERVATRLCEEKKNPYWPQRVPANDGGIALGQIYAARNNLGLK